MMDKYTFIDDIALPHILKKQASPLEIIKTTKKIVANDHNFYSLMRSIQFNNLRNLKKVILQLPNEMLKYSKLHTPCSKLNSVRSLNTLEGSFAEPYLTSVKSLKIKRVINKENYSLNDYFASMFFDFLSEVQDREFNFTYKKSKFEDHCLKNIEILKENLTCFSSFKKVYNVGKKEEVCLNIKSFKFSLTKGKVKHKIYLPFDMITVFALCTVEQIIFILSQCLENDEENGSIKLNEGKLATMINILPYFNTESKVDFSNKFKMNKNISFEWVTENSIYKANLVCPKICFNFITKNISISKYFTSELFLRVYPNEFTGWDKNVLNYLTMDKEFRNTFNKVITSTITTKTKINIDKRFKSIEIPSLEISIIPLVYQYNDELNYFVTIQGYRIELKGLLRTSYNISWKNSITLLKLKKLINLENFINRKTRLDEEGKILFDKNFIDYIDNELIGFFSNEKYDLDKPKQLYNLFEPCINCQTVINGRFNKQKLFFPSEYNEEIAKYKDIDSILDFFCKSLKNVVTMLILEDSII
jgi:hypothetical protein